MITHDVPQGSPEWLELRCGIPTASCFDQIVDTRWKRRTGEMPRTYMARLAAERLLAQPLDEFGSFAAERGTLCEPDALAWYELERGVDVQRVGFVTTDDGAIGCSPDGLVGEDGGVEIKSPLALSQSAAYVKALLADEAGALKPYAAQVYGGLWVCEREWWDLVLYHPTLPKRIIRVERDQDIIGDLSAALLEFAAELGGVVEKLQQMG